MSAHPKLGKYSIGVGDRFEQEAEAQLRACMTAAERGVEITPVWNKSNREHVIIGSEPLGTRKAANAAVKSLGWDKPYFVDADHIRLETVGRFLPHADFFTIDVADSIGRPPAAAEDVQRFLVKHQELQRTVFIPGLDTPLNLAPAKLEGIARQYLLAITEVGNLYRSIAYAKGTGSFIIEVSMDETDLAQSPMDLLVILAALADEQVPVQTIAPKFTGRFNKGVDYVGDLKSFEREFGQCLAVLAFAVRQYPLPEDLKLSLHSGSDKFSLYPIIRQALRRCDAGLHLKTAGTTWLEELIGLAESGGAGLGFARNVYAQALAHVEELCAPYSTVIEIDQQRLPAANVVAAWPPEEFAGALRHNPGNPAYNPQVRQLMHVAYKIAAQQADRFIALVRENKSLVNRNVTDNLYCRHIEPLFV